MSQELYTQIMDQVQAGYYDHKLPYVTVPFKQRGQDPERGAAAEAYQAEGKQLFAEFKHDALMAVGLSGHPKAEQAWGMAWDDGHSEGYHRVLEILYDLAELML